MASLSPSPMCCECCSSNCDLVNNECCPEILYCESCYNSAKQRTNKCVSCDTIFKRYNVNDIYTPGWPTVLSGRCYFCNEDFQYERNEPESEKCCGIMYHEECFNYYGQNGLECAYNGCINIKCTAPVPFDDKYYQKRFEHQETSLWYQTSKLHDDIIARRDEVKEWHDEFHSRVMFSETRNCQNIDPYGDDFYEDYYDDHNDFDDDSDDEPDNRQVVSEEHFNTFITDSYSNVSKRDNIFLEKTCSICDNNYDGESMVSILRCNHVFHKICVKHWLTKFYGTCPTCRTVQNP